MSTSPSTVQEYLDSLPEDDREVLLRVREVIRRNLPPGYVEDFRWGMISYEVPLEIYPKTYNGQPLSYVGLAARKNHYAVYLTGAYIDQEVADRLAERYRAEGRKLDMGKSCLRFRSLNDLSVDAIAEVVASTPLDRFIGQYEAGREKAPDRG